MKRSGVEGNKSWSPSGSVDGRPSEEQRWNTRRCEEGEKKTDIGIKVANATDAAGIAADTVLIELGSSVRYEFIHQSHFI
ncbi:hypothetical protein ACOSQ2_031475 [Xanthoceras sorbifolium]